MDNSETNKNLGQLFSNWTQKYSNNCALVQLDDHNEMFMVSYRQLKADTDALCNFLKENNIQQGDRVAMIAAKCMFHPRFFYACWTLGAIAVPICETLGNKEMGFIIGDSDPKLIITDKGLTAKVTANANGRKTVCLDDIPDGASLQNAAPLPGMDFSPEEIAALIYTSGSTGMPKGVMLSHKNLCSNALDIPELFQLHKQERIISLLPYWHAYALSIEIVAIMCCGVTIAIARDMKDFKKNIALYQPTAMIVVPRIVELFKASIDKKLEATPESKKKLIDKAIYNASRIFTARPRLDGGILRIFTHHVFYDPLVFRKFRQAFGGKLRFIVCGGAPLDLELQIFFKYLGIPLLQGYGLTETSPIVSTNLKEDHLLGSIGKPFPWLTPECGGDYTFKDEEGHIGKDVHGQLLVKGNCVMKGYWNHTDASAKSFEDGWLNTGDVAYQKDGYLFIEGRKGNMIVLIGGEKLHPEHVEDAVKNSPLITEAMVIGEKCKNVYVLANVNKDQARGLSAEELHKKLKEEIQRTTTHLAPYQKPKDVLVLPDFTLEDNTLTATMKIRRYKIQELYGDKIEEFLKANGEEIATKHEVGIASSKVFESLADPHLGAN
ncbi:MAG: AMP-binding protein [Victivallales bacterium]|nr:AMP-binding protein [Victivallales bacterium]